MLAQTAQLIHPFHRLLLLPLILAVFACAPAVTFAADDAFYSKTLQPFLVKNCFSCHGDQKQSGEFNLQAIYSTGLNSPNSIPEHAKNWDAVLTRLERGEMPPKKQPRPDPAELASVINWLENQLDNAGDATGARPNLSKVTIRRLNRSEYNNTIRDLLGVDFHPADDFPTDDSGYGFDNIGDVLSMSPTLLEKYLKAAEKVARRAIFGVEPLKPATTILQPWYIDFDTNRVVKADYDQTGLSMPYSVHVMYRIPVEADYDLSGIMRGFRPTGSDPVRLGFWIDGKLIHEGQIPVSLGPVPPAGEMNGLHHDFRTHLTAGEHWIAVSILNVYEGLPPAYKGPKPNKSTLGISKSPTENFVSNLVVSGPFDQVKGPLPQSQKLIFTCGHLDGKHDANCAREILTNLAHRAFRRPVTPAEVDRLLNIVAMVQKDGDTFDEALCQAIQSILVSPHFLFRMEPEAKSTSNPPAAPPQSRPLTSHELATRLSYFLWSSMPDDELLACADNHSLTNPDILEAQARRMLKDPKSRDLTENFGGQWLQFRGLESHTVERKKFQQYTDYTIMSMRQETQLFFDHIMREDRSVLDFIDANYTFLNQRLAEFYGIPDIKGHEFRKVELPKDSHRGGVLTQASVLTVSSYATRTAPTIRGKWVLENLLNAPPPDPPANVPSLKEEGLGVAISVRQQLQQHRENAVCASCHARMDPLGFGLDNFDAIGMWRTKDGQVNIDPSGELPDGSMFNGIEELKAVLLTQKRVFTECLADKMLTYALGRGLVRADHRTIRAVADDLEKNDYRFSSLVLGIVKSPAFQSHGLNLSIQSAASSGIIPVVPTKATP